MIKDHLVTSMTIHGLTPEVVTRTEHRVVDTTQFGLNGEWKLSSDLSLGGDAYALRSTRNSGGKDTWVVAGIPGDHTGYFQANPNALPSIHVTLQDGRDLAQASPTLGNADYGLHWAELGGDNISDTVKGLSFNGKYATDWGALEALRFGLGDTQRAKSRTRLDNLDNACQYCGYHYTFSQLGADVVRPLTLKNFMRNGGGAFPSTFVRFFGHRGLLQLAQGAGRRRDPGRERRGHRNLLRLQPDAGALQPDQLVPRHRGHAGRLPAGRPVGRGLVRQRRPAPGAHPDHLAHGRAPHPGHRRPDAERPHVQPQRHLQRPRAGLGPGRVHQAAASANLIYKLAPNLQLRAAAAQVMSRPSLDQLAPTAQDYTLDRNFRIDVRGSADLKPVEATQGDLSLEWYYNRKSMLSGAVFWKNIKHFVTYAVDDNQDIGVPGYLYDISHPINGDKAQVMGLELGLQHLWDNGFGVNLKYTATDTRAYVGGVHVGQLEGVSRSALSAALLYEDDKVNAQIAVDHNGRYTEALDTVGGYTRYGEPLTWVTASLAYNLTPDVTLFFEGKNLTDAFYRANVAGRTAMAGSRPGPHLHRRRHDQVLTTMRALSFIVSLLLAGAAHAARPVRPARHPWLEQLEPVRRGDQRSLLRRPWTRWPPTACATPATSATTSTIAGSATRARRPPS